MVFFKDFGKPAFDLFKGSKYSLGRTISVKSKGESAGFSLERKNGKNETKFSNKFDKLGNVELTFGAGNPSVELTPSIIKGVDTTISADADGKLEFSGKYTHSAFQAEMSLEACPGTSKHSTYLDCSLPAGPVHLGGSVKAEQKDVKDMAFALHSDLNNGLSVTVKTKDNLSGLDARLMKNINSTDVALSFGTSFKGEDMTGGLACRYKLDKASSVQAKVCSNGGWAAVYAHQMSKKAKVSLGMTGQGMGDSPAEFHYKVEFTA